MQRVWGAGLLFALSAASGVSGCEQGASSQAPSAGTGGAGTSGTTSSAGTGGTTTTGAGTGGTATSGTGGRGTAPGGKSATGGNSAAGTASGDSGRGGAATNAGASGRDGSAGAAGAPSEDDPCVDAALVWRTANKTNYTSYPDPGSEECVKYNGCMWAGQFAACDGKKPEAWVAAHAIVAAFPDFDALSLHDLCLRKGTSTIVVTVLDTCGDSDCDGCCTQNQGSAEELIDVESYTNERWGVPDGSIEWADLGPTRGGGCE